LTLHIRRRFYFHYAIFAAAARQLLRHRIDCRQPLLASIASQRRWLLILYWFSPRYDVASARLIFAV